MDDYIYSYLSQSVVSIYLPMDLSNVWLRYLVLSTCACGWFSIIVGKMFANDLGDWDSTQVNTYRRLHIDASLLNT